MTNAPLRSGMSDPETGLKCASKIDSVVDRDAIERSGGTGVRASRCGTILLVQAQYERFEGAFATGPYLRIGLAYASGGAVMQCGEGLHLSGPWRRGGLVVTPPHVRGTVRSDPIAMLGLAIDLDRTTVAIPCDRDRLLVLGSGFIVDDLLAAVLTALWHDADLHGASGAFLEHGVALIARRLSACRVQPTRARIAAPLSPARFRRLRDYVDARLDEDVSVTDMAAICGMEPSGFGRALRANIGLAPFAWLTRCRMERGRILLAQGMPVTQVAGMVGYANAGKFAAAFRRITGATPAAWRRTLP